jgi:hypothetical protein
LTERELTIVRMLANGRTSKEIALALDASAKTIDAYRRQDGPRAATLFAALPAADPPAGEELAWTQYFLAALAACCARSARAMSSSEAGLGPPSMSGDDVRLARS